jgi:cell division protein FtsL
MRLRSSGVWAAEREGVTRMGLPARRLDAPQQPIRRTHLHLVPAPASVRSSRAASRTAARADEARARTAFTAFVAVLAFVIVLGGARVTLITKAAESSLSEGTVQASIKAQRAEADQLEVDRSALSTPSRIAGIAASTMKMGEPRSVRYISMPSTAGGSAASGTSVVAQSASALGNVFGAVMHLSAGEAQSLLVGDLGLAGSR